MANDSDLWKKSSSEFVTSVRKLAQTLTGGEGELVQYVLWSAERWYCDGENSTPKLDCGSPDTIFNVVDCFAEMAMQGKVITVLKKLVPVEIVINEKTGKVIRTKTEGYEKHSGNLKKLGELTPEKREEAFTKIDVLLMKDKPKNFKKLYELLGLSKAPANKEKSKFNLTDAQSKISKTITTAIKKAVDESGVDELEALKDVKSMLTKEINARIKQIELERAEAEGSNKTPEPAAKTPAPATA